MATAQPCNRNDIEKRKVGMKRGGGPQTLVKMFYFGNVHKT